MSQLEFYSALFITAVVMVGFLWRALVLDKDEQENFIPQRGKRYSKNFEDYKKKLEQDLANGYLDQAEYDIELAQASRKFIAQVEALEIKKSHRLFTSKALAPVLLLVMALSAVIYFTVGAYPDLQIKQQLDEFSQVTDVKTFEAEKASLQRKLAKRIEQKPDNIDYRLLQARFAMQEQNYQEAVKQFRILAEMLPNDAQAQAYYAQALFLQNQQVVNPEIEALINEALLLDPNNITALGMQGMYAYEQKDYSKAINAWQRLVGLLPPDSQNGKMLAKGIAQAKAQLTPEQQAIAKGFNVSVNVSDAVPLATLAPDLTVFVFVKAVNGPVFPLAAKRLTLADLPIALNFSDADAMAAAKLSDFDQVEVTAKISSTGEPKGAAGDWFGKSAAVVWRDLKSELMVSIDQPQN